MIKRKLYYLLSPRLRFVVRRLYYYPIDLFEHITKKRDDLSPPRGLVFVGHGDFKKIGEELLGHIQQVYQIKPDDKVLDVGCGIGRLAVPLTGVIGETGRYEGFDIVKKGIDWCNAHIKARYPNFNFTHIDLKNDLYNLKTNREAKDFVFPYEDKTFDLVILTSVFTHMMPDDVDNYLFQINRVLKLNGKCLVTFFLLNDEIKKSIENRDQFNFPHVFENYRLMDDNVKEANIAYEEDYLVNTLLPKNNLKVEELHYGFWSGKSKEKCLSYQDMLLLAKTN